MANIDENVEVGVELAFSGFRLTARAVIAILNWFLDKDDREKYYQNINSREEKGKRGKQSTKELFEKYDNQEILPLKDNLEKEEMKFLSKELNKMGVDFSVHKVDNDNFSIFFAGKDIETIEKAMKNSVEKFTKREAKKEKAKDFFTSLREKMKREVEEETVDEDLTEEQKEEKVNEKMEEEFTKEATQAQKDLAEKLGISGYENMNRVEISLALEDAGADRSFFRDEHDKKQNEKTKVSYNRDKIVDLYEKVRDNAMNSAPIYNYENNIKDNFDDLLATKVSEAVTDLRNDLSADATYPTQEDIDNKIDLEYENIVETQRSFLESGKGRTDELIQYENERNEILSEAKKELGLSSDTKDDVVINKMTEIFSGKNKSFSSKEKGKKQPEKQKVNSQEKKPMFTMDGVNKRASEIKKESREKEKVKNKKQNKSL